MKNKLIMLIILTVLIMLPITSYAMADSAEEACVINGVTGEVIFEKNSNERRPMASTTKIMTAIIALERCSLDEVVTISRNAVLQEGSSAYLQEGDQVYMRDLLCGLMLNSGNDAAYAIAEYTFGNVDAFADEMNRYAWEKIGAVDTQFANPSGLPAEGHYSTAHDMALIMRYAMRNKDFCEIVATRTMISHPINREGELYFVNHNRLLDKYQDCIGGKTGYTDEAGRCLVTAAKRDGMMTVAVTFGDNNDWETHSELYDYAFSQCYPKKAASAGRTVKKASVDGKNYNFIYADDFVVPVSKDEKVELRVVNRLRNDLSRPVNAGEKVGIAEIYQGEIKIGEVDIISEDTIMDVSNLRLKASFFSSFIQVFNIWLM